MSGKPSPVTSTKRRLGSLVLMLGGDRKGVKRFQPPVWVRAWNPGMRTVILDEIQPPVAGEIDQMLSPARQRGNGRLGRDLAPAARRCHRRDCACNTTRPSAR